MINGTNGDYHIHTCNSPDSQVSVVDVVDTAIKRGLAEIAITDHNTIAGGLKASEYAKGKPITVIIGAEIQTDCGEVIGLGLKKEIKERHLEDVIKAIEDQGGEVLIPHPFGPFHRNRINIPLESLVERIDYIEVYNGRNIFGLGNRRAKTFAVKYRLKMTVGSDAHFAFEIGNIGSIRLNWRGLTGFFITAIQKYMPFHSKYNNKKILA